VTELTVNPPGDTPEGTSLTLLEKARSGKDEAAWTRLVSLYEPLVSRWCRLAGLQEADVADVRSEVFSAVHRCLSGFQKGPDQGSFRGWLRRITQNKMRDLWEHKRSGQQGLGGSDAYAQFLEVPSPEPSDGDHSGASVEEEAAILYRRALDLIHRDFEERTWKAFWRVVIDGQRPRDVAGELEMTPGAVSSAKARVLARLRQEFADLIEEEAESCSLPSDPHQGASDES
jgi:RNA polymerase sigma-70 factor (ECF subfamily)